MSGKVTRQELAPALRQELDDVRNYIDGTDAQALANHVANVSNPHSVTKAQVGLGSVDNVQQASKANFDLHVANTSNPHSVTAAQAGAVPVGRILTAGTGLTGGGALSSDLTFSLDLVYLDGRYLGKTAKASDSDKLDGLDSVAFMKHGDTFLSMGNDDGIVYSDTADDLGAFYAKIDNVNYRIYTARNIGFGTSSPTGGHHGNIYIQY